MAVTPLFAAVFVAFVGWFLVASAVAVGVEWGLNRYHDDGTAGLGPDVDGTGNQRRSGDG